MLISYNKYILATPDYSNEEKKIALYSLPESLFKGGTKTSSLSISNFEIEKFVIAGNIFDNLHIENSRFELCKVYFTVIDNSQVVDVIIDDLFLRGYIRIKNSDLIHIELTNSYLDDYVFLEKVKLKNCIFTKIIFGATFEITNSEFEKISVSECRLGVTVKNTIIRNSKFIDSDIYFSYFEECYFINSEFTNTHLMHAHFKKTVLDQITFIGEDLEIIVFEDSTLINVNFNNLSLKDTSFINTTLENPVNLTPEQLSLCKSIENIKGLSDDFLSEVAKLNPKLMEWKK